MFIERPIIKAAQTVQFALRLPIRSLYPKGLLQEAHGTQVYCVLAATELEKGKKGRLALASERRAAQNSSR
jgi:hypothetical protein